MNPSISIPPAGTVLIPPGKPGPNWYVLDWAGVSRFALPAGKADITVHLSFDLPKGTPGPNGLIVPTRPTRLIVGRVRYRPGEPPNPTARDTVPVPADESVQYLPYTWSDIDTTLSEGEEWAIEIHHNGKVPLPVSLIALKGVSLVAYVAEQLRLVPR